MRLMIDLHDEVYNNMVVKNEYTERDVIAVHNALMGAIRIPEGHGRLIDADEYKEHLYACETNGRPLHIMELDERLATVDDAPTIIEADKEYKVEVVTRGNCMMCGKELTEGLFFCKECGDKVNSGK